MGVDEKIENHKQIIAFNNTVSYEDFEVNNEQGKLPSPPYLTVD